MSFTVRLAADIVLWLAAIVVIVAYAYNSLIRPSSRRQIFIYQAMNLIGSVGFIWGMYILAVPQSVLLNIVWGSISIIALWKIRK